MNYPTINTALAEINALSKELALASSPQQRALILTSLITTEQRFARSLTFQREKEITTLLEEEDLSYSQAAQILGLSKGRISQIVCSAHTRNNTTPSQHRK